MVGWVSTASSCKRVSGIYGSSVFLSKPWRQLTEFEQGDVGEKVFAGGASAARLRQLCLAVGGCRNESPSAAAMSIALSIMSPLFRSICEPLVCVCVLPLARCAHCTLWVFCC